MGTNGKAPPWVVDKVWSDRLLPEIKGILGPYVLQAAPYEEDIKHATDMMEAVLTLPMGLRIACRVRRGKQLRRDPAWGEQFTIRSYRPSGMESELTKILRGWGSHFFYGFADEALLCWVLGDLSVFRLWFNRHLSKHGGVPPGQEIPNPDGTRFRVFAIEDLPGDFVLGRALPPEGLRWTRGYVGTNPIDLDDGEPSFIVTPGSGSEARQPPLFVLPPPGGRYDP